MLKSFRNKIFGPLKSCVNNHCKHAFRLRRRLRNFLKSTPLDIHIKSIELSRLYIHAPEVKLEEDEFCLVVYLSEVSLTSSATHHFFWMRVFYQLS